MGHSKIHLDASLRACYRELCGLLVAANTLMPSRSRHSVFYGGARGGDAGGPLVKVQRLKAQFPECRFGYNIVYLLSNATYLPDYALKLLRRASVPIVYNQNGVYYPGWYDGDWESKNNSMASPYRAANWVFYQSDFCRRAAAKFLGPREGDSEVLYNAVDASHFIPRQEWLQPRGRYSFLITGKIAPHLAYRVESAVMGLHYAGSLGLDACLKIAGIVDATVLSEIHRLRARLGLREDQLVFLGPYTQKSAPSVYRSADAYVMTKYNDPCPNAVLEALSCGLPVLYSASGGVPELVGDDAGIGLTCPVDDWERSHVPTTEEIGLGMISIARQHAAFAANARARALDRFDIPHWINRHKEVFYNLLGGEKEIL